MPIIPPSRGFQVNTNVPQPAQQASVSEASATRIRRLIQQHRDATIVTAQRIHAMVRQAGRADLEAHMGEEFVELVTAYESMRAFILAVDPNAEYPSLPE
jgi:phage gp29-like protein